MNWTKSERNSIDIDYFQKDLVIYVEQFFDDEIFFIQFKTVNIRQNIISNSFLFIFRMRIIDYIWKYH